MVDQPFADDQIVLGVGYFRIEGLRKLALNFQKLTFYYGNLTSNELAKYVDNI